MPKLPANDVVQFAIRQTLGDDLDVLNIHHVNTFKGGGGPLTGADLLAAAQEFFTLWTAAFSSHLGGDDFAVACVAKDLGVVNGAEATYVAPTPVQGGTGGGDFPANCAIVVSWKESISYRGGHPRTYLTAVPRSMGSDPQHVTGAYATALQAAANSLISAVTAGSWPTGWTAPEMVVVHYILDKVLQTPPIVSTLISALVNTRIDSQRRRLQA